MVFTFEQQHGRNWNTSSATTTPSPTTTINRTTTSTMINSSNTTTTIIPTLPPLPPPSYQHNHHHHTNTTTITPPTPRPLPCFNHHYTTTITTTTIKPYNKRRRSSWTHGLYEYTAFEHLQMCLAPHEYTVSRNSEWLDTFRVVVVDFRVLEQSRASLWRRSSISGVGWERLIAQSFSIALSGRPSISLAVFSRVLRDSTPRFVGPSVRRSVRPLVHPLVRPLVCFIFLDYCVYSTANIFNTF